MKYLIVGNKGQLGREFEKYFASKSFEFEGFDIDEIDISDIKQLNDYIVTSKPGIIINCSAYNQVDLAEESPQIAFATNDIGVRNLATISKKTGAFLVHYSTDYVFDGTKENGLYTETDTPNPLGQYAKSKYQGEISLKKETDNYLLFRLSWVFGDGQQNFIHKFLQWTKTKDYLKVACDEVSVPTSTKTIVEVTLKSIEQGIGGLFHLTNSGYCSRYEWGKNICKIMDLDKVLYPVSKDIFNLPAKRPGFSAMSNKKIAELLGIEIPCWEYAVKDFLKKL